MPFTNCSKLFIDPTVRVTAADSLRSLRATDAIPALQNSLQSKGDEVAREHLRETLRVLQLLPIGIKKRRKIDFIFLMNS